MIICIGPVCVPVWHIGMILLVLFKPIWLFILSFFPYTTASSNTANQNEIYSVPKIQCSTYSGEIKTKTEWDNIVSLAHKKSQLVIIQYSGSFCKPCKLIAPKFKELSNQFNGIFSHIDIENEHVSGLFLPVTVLPTFRIFHHASLNHSDTTVKHIFQVEGADLSPLLDYFKKNM